MSATQLPSSATQSASSPATVPSDESSSRSASTSHSPSGVAIAGIIVGLFAVIALVIVACCLLRRRMRVQRRVAGAQSTLAVSPYPSYFGWLPRKSWSLRSSYQASQAESLCSDSQLSVSEAESKQPFAVWNPWRFVREQAESATDAGSRAQESSLPSGTPATVASGEGSEGAQT
ncbi:hypothetical protein V8D89_014736 [Ganoderma adspersum]